MGFLILILILVLIIFLIFKSRFKKIIKLFKDGNVCVVGLRGRGKDMLISNVVCRRNEPYISNCDYGLGSKHIDFDPNVLDIKNSYKNFITGNVKKYVHPYKDGIDLYISDVGVYMPASYHKELSRDFPQFPVFLALSRQVSLSNVHINCQNLSQAWDKLRSQCDTYIHCDRCKYFKKLKLVVQRVTIYDNEEACIGRKEPFLVKAPLFASREVKTNIKMQKLNYISANGHIERKTLIYFNRSNYNTRIFKEILENGI